MRPRFSDRSLWNDAEMVARTLACFLFLLPTTIDTATTMMPGLVHVTLERRNMGENVPWSLASTPTCMDPYRQRGSFHASRCCLPPPSWNFFTMNSLAHVHLGEDEKERAKDILGMRTVPFYVVVGEVRTLLHTFTVVSTARDFYKNW